MSARETWWHLVVLTGSERQSCLHPSGIGFASLMILFFLNIYHIIVSAWILFYLYNSFKSPLPWTTCDNWWNTGEPPQLMSRVVSGFLTDFTGGAAVHPDTHLVPLPSPQSHVHLPSSTQRPCKLRDNNLLHWLGK